MDEETNVKRLRRHTIARPASALALLTDNTDCEEEGEDYRFDRISNILSSLIQEANEAVNTTPTTTRSSSIPLVRKLSTSLSTEQQRYQKKASPFRSSSRPISYPVSLRRSKTPSYPNLNSHKSIIINKKTMPLTKQIDKETHLSKSFERLNSSLAIIDSLSRDLAIDDESDGSDTTTVVTSPPIKKNKTKRIRRTSFDPRLSAFILLPLLQVPHLLISTAFDTLSSYDDISSSSTTTLSGVFIWAIVFAITNLMVDQAVSPKKTTVHTLSFTHLPGSFVIQPDLLPKKKKIAHDNKKSHYYNKKQQLMQYPHQHYSMQPLSISPNQKGVNLKRRNSL